MLMDLIPCLSTKSFARTWQTKHIIGYLCCTIFNINSNDAWLAKSSPIWNGIWHAISCWSGIYVILTSCILCPFVGIIFYLTYGMLCQFQGMQGYPQAAFPQPTYQQPVYPQHAYPQTQPQPQPQPVNASNPFDLGNEPASIQAHLVWLKCLF